MAASNQKLSSKKGIKGDSAKSGTENGPNGLSGTSILECFFCNRVGSPCDRLLG